MVRKRLAAKRPAHRMLVTIPKLLIYSVIGMMTTNVVKMQKKEVHSMALASQQTWMI